jgi:6-phosphogluconate dehydrogenase
MLPSSNTVTIVTGVSGSGKTTIGTGLAHRLGISFYDGDEFHTQANIIKLSSGVPLTDEDRQPWLQAINAFIRTKLPTETFIISCSALKESYRATLATAIDPAYIKWIHLQGEYDIIFERMRKREGHFMGAAMLHSQIATYEAPTQGLVIDVRQDYTQTIDLIIKKMQSHKADVGLIGMGVMGTSLARNIAGKGFSISLYNRHVTGKEENVAKKKVDDHAELKVAQAFDDLEKFIESLQSPKKIILMVNAGKAVDAVIENISPLLKPGDVLVDGGNSHYTETESRQKQLAAQGIHFIGAGISGGEEGALLGPSIMPGGTQKGYDLTKYILRAIAAKNNQGEVCCDYIGDGGAGHFVKMIHNGIEYAEMQLIAEVYSHLRYDQKKEPEEIAAVFSAWNQSDAGSYLLEITTAILKFKDIDGSLLLDKIWDVAGNKGTGSWTTVAASELGVPVPTIAEALFARYLSSLKEERLHYANLFVDKNDAPHIPMEHLRQTYQFCRIINHHQGFALISEASKKFDWRIDIGSLLQIWSGGCIIRSVLLNTLRNDWPDSQDMLQHRYVVNIIQRHFQEIKTTMASLALSHQGYPAMVSCLAYFKGLKTGRGNANLIQAQRDFFGAHTYKRTDDPEGLNHHTNWNNPKR